MKKYILSLLLLLTFPVVTFATSGTCSDHDGVMCSAGADSDGSAICNDGWRDSSELYSSTKLCADQCFVSAEERRDASEKAVILTKKMMDEATEFSNKYLNATPPLSVSAQSQINDYRNRIEPLIAEKEAMKSSCNSSMGRGYGDVAFTQGLVQSCLDNLQKSIDSMNIQMNGMIGSLTEQDIQNYKKSLKMSYDVMNEVETDQLNDLKKITKCGIYQTPEVFMPQPAPVVVSSSLDSDVEVPSSESKVSAPPKKTLGSIIKLKYQKTPSAKESVTPLDVTVTSTTSMQFASTSRVDEVRTMGEAALKASTTENNAVDVGLVANIINLLSFVFGKVKFW